MAGVTDDFAFLGDHGMAALGAGVEEGFFRVSLRSHLPPEFEQRRQGRDQRLMLGVLRHEWRLARAFNPSQWAFLFAA